MEPGMSAVVTDWGGDESLNAHVRSIEPGGFTKVSALGVEEQRVNVILDFDRTPTALQDGFHVLVDVVLWESSDVLLIPSSAVFRTGNDWATFVAEKGHAKLTKVQVGHRGDEFWEVIGGIAPDAAVIVHPPAEVSDGASIRT